MSFKNTKEKINDVKEKITGPAEFQQKKIEIASDMLKVLKSIDGHLYRIEGKLYGRRIRYRR